jgi:hypothetical protein
MKHDIDAKLGKMEQMGTRTRSPKAIINRSKKAARAVPRRTADDEKHTVDAVLQFEIYDETHPDVLAGRRPRPDDPLVIQIKGEINKAGITRRDLYAFINSAEDALFENANQAYNLEYGLRKRPTISLSCAARWLAVLGKEIVISFQNAGGAGWYDTLMDEPAVQEYVASQPDFTSGKL